MSISSWAVLGQPAGPRPRPERFEVLTKHLVRLGDIAWQQGIDTWKPKLEEHICVKNKGVEHKVLIRVTHVEGWMSVWSMVFLGFLTQGAIKEACKILEISYKDKKLSSLGWFAISVGGSRKR